jgi:hypothetical protein
MFQRPALGLAIPAAVPNPIEGTFAILDELKSLDIPTYATTNFSREKFAVFG